MNIVDNSETQPRESEHEKGKAREAYSTPVLFYRVEYTSGRIEQWGFRSRFFHKSIKHDNYAGLTLPVLVEAASIGIRDHEAEVKWRTGERGR